MIDWTFRDAVDARLPEAAAARDDFEAAIQEIDRIMRSVAEATRPTILAFQVAVAPLTGDRTRIRCACGANPRAIDWQRHTWPSVMRRRPWRRAREHRPS